MIGSSKNNRENYPRECLKAIGPRKNRARESRHARGEGVAVREAHENRFFPPSESVENFLVKRLWEGYVFALERKLSIKENLR